MQARQGRGQVVVRQGIGEHRLPGPGACLFGRQRRKSLNTHARGLSRAVGAAPCLDGFLVDEAPCCQGAARPPGDIGVIASREVAHSRLVFLAAAGAELGDEGSRVRAPGIGVLRFAREPNRRGEHLLVDLCAGAARQEGGDRLGDEEKETVADRRLGLGGDRGEHSDDETARIQQTVAHGVPQRRPDDGAGDRRVDGAHVRERDVGRAFVQPRDRVGEVIVVDDNKVRGSRATGDAEDSLGVDGCALTVDTDVKDVRALEGSGGDPPGGHGHAVRAQHAVACLSALMEREVRDRTDAVRDP